MTANNKLDRKAFPEPIFGQSNDYVAPRDPIEIELCTTFEQILSVKRVGIHDDFFELGGHSLLAVKLVNHLKKAFGTELSVALLAQYSTVERLGEIIRENKEIKPSIVIELRRGTYEQPLWLFHPIGGSTFCYMELSRHLNPNRTLRAIQSPGLIEPMLRKWRLKKWRRSILLKCKRCSLKDLISSVAGVSVGRLHMRSVVSCVK